MIKKKILRFVQNVILPNAYNFLSLLHHGKSPSYKCVWLLKSVNKFKVYFCSYKQLVKYFLEKSKLLKQLGSKSHVFVICHVMYKIKILHIKLLTCFRQRKLYYNYYNVSNNEKKVLNQNCT